jgi:arylsulfatase A
MKSTRLHPNIVLIVADYLGASDIGPYGATDIQTPSLDKLATQGVRLTSNYAAAPICSPSRAALMTGRYPVRTGIEDSFDRDGGLSTDIPAVPALLKNHGYKSGLIGKWHLGHSDTTDPLAHGFDEFFGFHEWSINHYTHRNDEGKDALLHNRTLVKRDGYLTDILTDEGIRFMQENRDGPFFLFQSYNAALPPYLGPNLPRDRWVNDFSTGSATRADYIAMVEAMDAGIGRLLAALDTQGLAEDTLVLFTYDHNGRGIVRNHPFTGGFAMLNEGGIRVPLIMRWPGKLAAGKTLRAPAIGMDIPATILGAGGVETGALGLDGRNLLEEAVLDEPRTFCWRMQLGDFGQAAIRRGHWKLLVHRLADFSEPSLYLFDIEADPSESHDLYYRDKPLADGLYRELIQWEASVAKTPPRARQP